MSHDPSSSGERPYSLGLVSYYTSSPDSSHYLARLPGEEGDADDGTIEGNAPQMAETESSLPRSLVGAVVSPVSPATPRPFPVLEPEGHGDLPPPLPPKETAPRGPDSSHLATPKTTRSRRSIRSHHHPSGAGSTASHTSYASHSTASSEHPTLYRAQHARVASASSHTLLYQPSMTSVVMGSKAPTHATGAFPLSPFTPASDSRGAAVELRNRSTMGQPTASKVVVEKRSGDVVRGEGQNHAVDRRASTLGLGLGVRPSVEVDPERLDQALGSLPWPELPPRVPVDPGSALPSPRTASGLKPRSDDALDTGHGQIEGERLSKDKGKARAMYSFLENDPLPSGLPSAITNDRGRSASRRSSRSSISSIQSNMRSASRGARSIRTGPDSADATLNQPVFMDQERERDRQDARRLSVPYSPTLAHSSADSHHQHSNPQAHVRSSGGRAADAEQLAAHDTDVNRHSAMSIELDDRPLSAMTGMADLDAMTTDNHRFMGHGSSASRSSMLSLSASGSGAATGQQTASPSGSRGGSGSGVLRSIKRFSTRSTKSARSKSVRSAKSTKSAKSGKSGKRVSNSTITNLRHASRRWEVWETEEEYAALVGDKNEPGDGTQGGNDMDEPGGERRRMEEMMELGQLVGRAAVLERILRAGKRVSAQSVRRPYTIHTPHGSTSTHRPSPSLAPSNSANPALPAHPSQQSFSASRPVSRSSRPPKSSRSASASTSLRYRLSRRLRRRASREDQWTEIGGSEEHNGSGRGGREEGDEGDDPNMFPAPVRVSLRPGTPLGLPFGDQATTRSVQNQGNKQMQTSAHGVLVFPEEVPPPTPPKPEAARLRDRLNEAIAPPSCLSPLSPPTPTFDPRLGHATPIGGSPLASPGAGHALLPPSHGVQKSEPDPEKALRGIDGETYRQSPHLGHRDQGWRKRRSVVSYIATGEWDERAKRRWVWGVGVGCGVVLLVLGGLLGGLLGRREG